MKKTLESKGVKTTIFRTDDGIHTAEQAAAAAGTTVERIVKSLLLIDEDGLVLLLVSGANMVDIQKIRDFTGRKKLRMASAKEVKKLTGFAVGGVPPIGFDNQPPTIIDKDLLQYDIVYADGGNPFTLFPISPDTLRDITNAKVCELKVIEQKG
ncbi:MAG: YbaK/EbsC family protein [Synergistetes bacterium]|nr:YbaK/EbsC family protein [Synergistota bacterium]